MNKKLLGLVFAIIALTIGVSAQSLKTVSLGFIAPQIDDVSHVSNPAVGEIVFEANVSNPTFKGFVGPTSTDWIAFGGSGSGGGVPSGTVLPYAGTTAPTGFHIADGTAVSRTTYSTLFGIIGTDFGSGDGTTTFNLPDLRGIFVRGAGSQTISSVTYNGILAAKESDQFQSHFHSTNIIANGNSNTGVYTAGASGTYNNFQTGAAISDGTTAVRAGNETRPANISLTYIIKM